jgi:hypothetical protein
MKQLMEVNGPLYARAVEMVPGVVAARQRHDIIDARFVINSYLEDARGMGASPEQAFSMLFSAATVWVSTLVECRAFHHGESPTETIRELGILAAQAVSEN